MLTRLRLALFAILVAAGLVTAAPAGAATDSPVLTSSPTEPTSAAPPAEATTPHATLVVDEDDSPFVVEIDHRGQADHAEHSHHADTGAEAAAARIRDDVQAAEDLAALSPATITPESQGVPWIPAYATSGLYVTYSPSFPAPSMVRPAINAAVAEWSRLLDTRSTPVQVNVTWKSFGNANILGYAGPKGLYTSGALPSGHLYPVGLANVLLGHDLNGSDAEIDVTLNADLYYNGGWYYGTSGKPGPGQLDLMSVVAHEVGHGLGFLGSGTQQGNGSIHLYSPPFTYDALARFNGADLLGAINQSTALTSNNLLIKASATRTAELHAPATWRPGSSYGHLRATLEQANSIMTPSLMAGTTKRTADSMVLGVLQQMGWPTTVRAVTPTITDVSVSGSSVFVTWRRNDLKPGLPTDRYRLDIKKGGTVVQSTLVGGTATAAGVDGLAANTGYSAVVVPLGATGAGTPAVAGFSTDAGSPPVPDNEPIEVPGFVRAEPLDGQVFRVYHSHFLRAPDRQGFEYWLERRAAGTDLGSMVSAFANGSEFQQRYGTLSDHQFVALVYRNVLGREADARGLTHWVGQLGAGMTRAEVMIGFIESAEYITRTGTTPGHSSVEGSIRRLYQAFFLRQPDAGGLAHWVSVARSGSSLESIAQSFASSAEFRQRYGSRSNQRFVELVYRNVLERNPDTAGYRHWVGQLNAGMSRGAMMVGFSQSPEFIRATGTLP